MNLYLFGIEFWATVGLAFIAAPFLVAIAKETAATLSHLLHQDPHELASMPSAPRPSRP